jgi:hypothetical protein
MHGRQAAEGLGLVRLSVRPQHQKSDPKKLADADLGEARAARSAPRMGKAGQRFQQAKPVGMASGGLYLRSGLSGTGRHGRSRPAKRHHRSVFPSFGRVEPSTSQAGRTPSSLSTALDITPPI